MSNCAFGDWVSVHKAYKYQNRERATGAATLLARCGRRVCNSNSIAPHSLKPAIRILKRCFSRKCAFQYQQERATGSRTALIRINCGKWRAYSLHCCSSNRLLRMIHRCCRITRQLLLDESLGQHGVRLRLYADENLRFRFHLICSAVSAKRVQQGITETCLLRWSACRLQT